MPSRQTPKSKPNAERPSSAGSDALAAYRQPDPSGGAKGPNDKSRSRTPPQVEREKREKVQWTDLVEIPNLEVIDGWTDTNVEYGDYCGTIIRLPTVGKTPSKDVLALTSASTRAGKWLTHQHATGAFDLFDGSGDVSRGIIVRGKKSPNYPDGNPMILLAWVE